MALASWPRAEVIRVRDRDRIPVAVIWLLVLVGVVLVGRDERTRRGGRTGCRCRYRTDERLSLPAQGPFVGGPDADAEQRPCGCGHRGLAQVVVMLLLWVAASVISILLRVPDGYSVILGWLLPLAAFLVYRHRRSAGQY